MKNITKGVWTWLMNLTSEKKDGAATGTPSITRVLTLACFGLWATLALLESIGVGEDAAGKGVAMAQTVEYTLWGLLGLKGVTTSTKNLRGSGG